MSELEAETKRWPLHVKILIGLIVGAVLGLSLNFVAASQGGADENANNVPDWLDMIIDVTEPVGKIFLRLMFMVVVPLVLSALALAVVEIGDVRKLGRVGLRTMAYTGILSSAAVVIGLVLVNTLRPGSSLTSEQQRQLREKYSPEREAEKSAQQTGIERGENSASDEKDRAAAKDKVTKATQRKSLKDTIVDIIPENPLQEMVGAVDGSSKGNGMLAVMFFALVFGMAIAARPEQCATLVGWLEGLYAVAMVVINFAMKLAPYGAGALVFSITAQLGLDIVLTLMYFVGATLLGLGLHLVVVYSIFIWAFGGMSPRKFFSSVSEAMLVAFGTSSSSATLPTALRVAEDQLKLPPHISNFVLTVGATGNQNGTALYEGVVVLFLAQVFGVDLTLPQQLTVVLMSILAGIGTAGVPGGSLPLIVVLLQSVGVPGEGIGIILGVDRLLDMGRTVLNVTGDLAIATCVAHGERKALEKNAGKTAPTA